MLTPVLALVTWTLLIWVWMYALRIPAMLAADIDADKAKHPGSLDGLPSTVRAVADNYNHLHEQPTIFYALVLYSHLAGHNGSTLVMLAWAYVGLRIVHSLIQNTSNIVMLRFSVFALSTIVLMWLAVINLLAL
jgi:hypothetical protein